MDLYSLPTYLISFTENEDDAAQWERYGYGGEGVCIVFDKEALALISKRNGIQLDYVSYVSDYNLVPDTRLLAEYAEFGKLPVGIQTEKELFDFFGCHSSLYKHPSFRSENEYRMYYSSQKNNRTPSKLIREPSHDGRIREFFEFDWRPYTQKEGLNVTDVIPKVILGPKRKVNKDILKRKLNDSKSRWNGKIVDSDCPLR